MQGGRPSKKSLQCSQRSRVLEGRQEGHRPSALQLPSLSVTDSFLFCCPRSGLGVPYGRIFWRSPESLVPVWGLASSALRCPARCSALACSQLNSPTSGLAPQPAPLLGPPSQEPGSTSTQLLSQKAGGSIWPPLSLSPHI